MCTPAMWPDDHAGINVVKCSHGMCSGSHNTWKRHPTTYNNVSQVAVCVSPDVYLAHCLHAVGATATHASIG